MEKLRRWESRLPLALRPRHLKAAVTFNELGNSAGRDNGDSLASVVLRCPLGLQGEVSRGQLDSQVWRSGKKPELRCKFGTLSIWTDLMSQDWMRSTRVWVWIEQRGGPGLVLGTLQRSEVTEGTGWGGREAQARGRQGQEHLPGEGEEKCSDRSSGRKTGK